MAQNEGLERRERQPRYVQQHVCLGGWSDGDEGGDGDDDGDGRGRASSSSEYDGAIEDFAVNGMRGTTGTSGSGAGSLEDEEAAALALIRGI